MASFLQRQAQPDSALKAPIRELIAVRHAQMRRRTAETPAPDYTETLTDPATKEPYLRRTVRLIVAVTPLIHIATHIIEP